MGDDRYRVLAGITVFRIDNRFLGRPHKFSIALNLRSIEKGSNVGR